MGSTCYPERHWMYESEEENTYMPPFMNDGYAPPDWNIIQTIDEVEHPALLPPVLDS